MPELAERLERRPGWWTDASCRRDSPEMWCLERGESVEQLREVCAGCPVSGDCLRAAIAEPAGQREVGPVRVGIAGPRPWRLVRRLVDDLEPLTDADYAVIAAWLLDDRAHLEVA